ncbi:hypothetical protein PLO_1406 [Pediococcus acidilactici NGRI 0510Q]|nr:hypothetical protein PLO_1406 [Pediococcus acidilactici NGRI 0510Q]
MFHLLEICLNYKKIRDSKTLRHELIHTFLGRQYIKAKTRPPES